MDSRYIAALCIFATSCLSRQEIVSRDLEYDTDKLTVTDAPYIQGDFIMMALKKRDLNKGDTDEVIPLCIPLYRTPAYEEYQKRHASSPNQLSYEEHQDRVDVVVRVPYSFRGCELDEAPAVEVKLGPANRGVRPTVVEIMGRRFSFEESMASFLYYFNLTSRRLPYRIRLEPAFKQKRMFAF